MCLFVHHCVYPCASTSTGWRLVCSLTYFSAFTEARLDGVSSSSSLYHLVCVPALCLPVAVRLRSCACVSGTFRQAGGFAVPHIVSVSAPSPHRLSHSYPHKQSVLFCFPQKHCRNDELYATGQAGCKHPMTCVWLLLQLLFLKNSCPKYIKNGL